MPLKKEDIIMWAHKELGHASPRTTYDYIKVNYYGSSMREDVYKTLKICRQCLAFNDKRPGNVCYPLLIGEAFERIGIDLMGPFKETKNGNKFIIVGIDYLTKFIEIAALKEKNAENIVEFIYTKIILNHGCPNTILSDNGREFNNTMVRLLCEKLRVNKKYSSPYRPQTNGLVERTNRTLIAIISKYVEENGVEWDECLNTIRFHYNIRPQESLGFSPFELIFGRKPNTPIMEMKSKDNESCSERVKRINNRQLDVMNKRREIQKKKVKELKYKLVTGDFVLYKNRNRNSKFDAKWIGPYVINRLEVLDVIKSRM